MATGTISIVANAGGKSINQTITKTFDKATVYDSIVLAAGKAATDWVYTDVDDAACNLSTNHGYTNGKVDVYWPGGVRYDVDMVVSTNALALDGGAGDNFPASETTGVIVCTVQQINTAIDGDEMAMIAINATQRAHLYFEDAAGDAIGAVEIATANEPYFWHDSNGATNPLTGDPVTVCFASNGTVTAATLDIIVGEDSTP